MFGKSNRWTCNTKSCLLVGISKPEDHRAKLNTKRWQINNVSTPLPTFLLVQASRPWECGVWTWLERRPDLEPDSLAENYKTIPENQLGDWTKRNQKKAELEQMYLSEFTRLHLLFKEWPTHPKIFSLVIFTEKRLNKFFWQAFFYYTSRGSSIPFLVTMICLGCSSTGSERIKAATSSAVFHLAN